MLSKLFLCIFPIVAIAQNKPVNLLTTGLNACAGNGVMETNLYITHHLSVSKHNLFFVNYGSGLSFISTDNQLAFKSPNYLDPTFNKNENRMNFISLNFHFGVKFKIIKHLFFGANVDLLGVSFGKNTSSQMMADGKAYPYDATIKATNFLLNGVNGGNLFHTLELIYVSEGLVNYKIGLANQSITYEYTSTMPNYTSFSLYKFAYMGFIGVEWKLPCK